MNEICKVEKSMKPTIDRLKLLGCESTCRIKSSTVVVFSVWSIQWGKSKGLADKSRWFVEIASNLLFPCRLLGLVVDTYSRLQRHKVFGVCSLVCKFHRKCEVCNCIPWSTNTQPHLNIMLKVTDKKGYAELTHPRTRTRNATNCETGRKLHMGCVPVCATATECKYDDANTPLKGFRSNTNRMGENAKWRRVKSERWNGLHYFCTARTHNYIL